MKRTFPTDVLFYEASYGDSMPIEQLFLIYFDNVVSKHANNTYYSKSIFKHLISLGYTQEIKVFKNRRQDNEDDNLFVNLDKKIFVRVWLTNEKKDAELYRIQFYYSLKNGPITDQFDFVGLKALEKTKDKGNISLVKSEMGHLDTQDYDLDVPDMDLELNYGKNFLKVHNVIIDKLNQPRGKGIILLHGSPGTGKTSYLKYLTKHISEKNILFIPPSMAEMLSEPSIIPFLMDNKNSILVIEDAERVIADREGNGSSAGVSNVLNITDGILGDCLNIQIIATFNMKRERIDQALLRKGRLIAEHKFENLNVEETNNLLKYLGKDQIVEEGMSLADIYNIDVELLRPTNNTSKIGF